MGLVNRILILLIFVMMRNHCSLVARAEADGTSCIALVAQQNFRSNSTVALIKTHEYNRQRPALVDPKHRSADHLVQLLEKTRAFSLIILDLTVNHGKECFSPRKSAGHKAVDYFIIVGGYEEVSNCVRAFRFGKLTDDRGQFVVLLEGDTKNASDKVMTVLAMFEERWQQHAAVLVANEQQTEIDIYTWFPFDKTPLMRIVNKCDEHGLRYRRPLFQAKLPPNMNGKIVKIGVVGGSNNRYTCHRIGGGFAGLDTEIVWAMASVLNFNPMYYSTDDLKKQTHLKLAFLEKDASLKEGLKYRTLSGDIDIAIGGYYLKPNMSDEFGFIYPYLRDTAHFFVTPELVLYTSTEGRTKKIILLLVSIHICASLTMRLLNQNNERRTVERDAFRETSIMVWSLLTNLPGNIPNFSSLRQLLLWVAYAFPAINMYVAYKSLLTSVLARPLYAEKIQTFEELVESGLPYWPYSREVLYSHENEHISRKQLNQLLTRQPECNIGRCSVEILLAPQHILSALTGDIKLIEFILPERSYHIIDKTIVGLTLDYTMYTSQNFFLNRKMTTMIHRSAQAGLINYWSERTLRNCDFKAGQWPKLRNADNNRSTFEKHPDKIMHPFSIALLKYPLQIMGLGLCLAGVVFILEVVSSTQTSRFMWAYLKRRGWIIGYRAVNKLIHCLRNKADREKAAVVINYDAIVTKERLVPNDLVIRVV